MEEIEQLKEEDAHFQVVIRCSPIIKRHSNQIGDKRDEQALFIDQQQNKITVCYETDQSLKIERAFAFNKIITPLTTQAEVYSLVAQPLIQNALQGFNVNFIAYGQTGSGKRYTLYGKSDDNNEEEKGFIYRACNQIFEYVDENPKIKFIIKVSIFDIYLEEIEDMLSGQKDKLRVREIKGSGAVIENLTELAVTNKQQLLRLFKQAQETRQMRFLQAGGSLHHRSHKIIQLKIEGLDCADPLNTLQVSLLKFVILPGSERIGKAGISGISLSECKSINVGLGALGNVISSLSKPDPKHVPYRDSKITRILQNSLGGNSKTVFLATVSLALNNVQESLSTLIFASRAPLVKNQANINKITDEQIIESFRSEYALLYSNKSITFIQRELGLNLKEEENQVMYLSSRYITLLIKKFQQNLSENLKYF